MLPDFLAAVAGLWDELCVADTGSTDDSVPLLEAAGARVESFPWCDDFAAARNASLAMATGDWVLFLDADERPTPELRSDIRALLGDPGAGAATVVMCNALPHGHVRESRLLRLFRRDPAIRFTHRIHEEVSTAVGAMLTHTGRRLVHLDGRVQHLGYVRQVATSRSKKERDSTLLQACVQEDPRDWYSWYKLLELARFWQDDAMAFETAAAVAPRLPVADLHGQPWGGEFLTLVAQGLGGDAAAQLKRLDAWCKLADPSPSWHLRRGMLWEARGDLARASREFASCLGLPPAADPSLTTVRPHLGLCRVVAASGNIAAAIQHIDQALSFNPRDPEALHAGVAFAWLSGKETALAKFLKKHPASDELSLATGEQFLRAGLWDEACRYLARAAGSPPQGHPALLLARAELGRGDAARALAICQRIAHDTPAATLGAVTCALALGATIELTVNLEAAAAEKAFREWIDVLIRGRSESLMHAFGIHCVAVLDVFPWLEEFAVVTT